MSETKGQWLDFTEIVAGFIYRGKLDANIVNPDDLYPPYNQTISTAREAKDIDELRETIIEKHGYSIWRDAVEASEGVNSGTTPLNWVKVLETAASKYKAGVDLAKLADQLKAGKEVDAGRAMQLLSSMELGYRSMTPLSDVEPEKENWIKTGYAPIDDYFRGIPKSSLTIIAAPPGVGKTTLMLKMGLSMLRKYKNKKIAIFSLEMLMSQLVGRYLDMDKNITQKERSRILASESAYTMSEVYAVASRVAATEKLSAIFIDFADLLVEGQQSEQVMGQIYREAAMLARQAKIPVVLVCQLNRTTYTGGVPRIHHIRYSSMAEMMSAMIYLLHNPTNILADHNGNSPLPPVEKRGYIIGGKARFGFKYGNPGAIQVEWDGAAGWGDRVYGQYIQLTGV